MLIKTALNVLSPAGQGAKLSILIFHRVVPVTDPLFPDESCIARFDEIMGWVAHWFNVLPMEEAIARLRSNSLPARAAAITFDDGYADNLTCAVPVLKKHGLHATFFISTGFLDGGRMWNDTIIESIRTAQVSVVDASFVGLGQMRISSVSDKRVALDKIIMATKHLPVSERDEAVEKVRMTCMGVLPNDLMLTTAQVRELHQCGMGVGAHTVTHPILAKLPDDVAQREIADSRDCLEGIIGDRVSLFAYPNGKLGIDYLQVHADQVKAMRFAAAFSTTAGVASRQSDIYQLPRFTAWGKQKWRFALRTLGNYRY